MARLEGNTLGMTAALAVAAACTTTPSVAPSSGTGGTNAQGGSSSGSGLGAPTSSTTAAVAVGAGGFGGGDAPFVCDPPAQPGSIYELTADSFSAPEPVSMCKYRGGAMLLVNVAAL